MNALPMDISDEELIKFIDQWITLLEREDYEAAYNYITQGSKTDWTPELIREVIKSYGDADPNLKATLEGTPTDITQRKKIDWWTTKDDERRGEIWYDLNIDGKVTDLTARFNLLRADNKITVQLNDIHVM